ncbi:Gcd10p family protein [Coniella lustricola]|uniref:tRNA (adenine(58)-N(1))-methyltransferase non-catalytic subunit TRM6 n=1 Tax=Coniella lustricola TaxID=2025994 RepID=A0A2T3A110_9PEZI|nr:Gcd10p family protein [Coniella lustricola]
MVTHTLIEPNAWVLLRLPNGTTRLLQILPNTTLSLGRYGAFPSNLILGRPYHLTYELQDKDASSNSFSRLRVVPASELHADVIAEESSTAPRLDGDGDGDDGTGGASLEDNIISASDGVEYSLVDSETGAVVVRSNREIIDDNARQTLTWEEIEALKRDGTDSGQDLIAKLMLAHTGMDQKTTFSMAKYKLLKEKKFLRRFTVLPVDVSNFGNFWLGERDASKIMEMREEMIGLVGCWANVHYTAETEDQKRAAPDAIAPDSTAPEPEIDDEKPATQPEGTRYLVVDDTGGLLVASLAEKMGLLYSTGVEPTAKEESSTKQQLQQNGTAKTESNVEGEDTVMANAQEPTAAMKRDHEGNPKDSTAQPDDTNTTAANKRRQLASRKSDFHIPYSTTNTMTLVHTNGQPNLTHLNYWDFDSTNPNHPPHPLLHNLLTCTWLQLLEPQCDSIYTAEPPSKTDDEIAAWKPNRRGNYHRKRRRWARTRYVVDNARAGGFSGLVVASTMDPVSVLRPLLPLLEGGAPVAIYSPHIEPLAKLVDCFSVARRAAFVGQPDTEGKTPEELERWQGTEEFPVNPMLLLGVQLHNSRTQKWQVLPGRTHPVMTARGGADGYVFTAWRAKPAEGKIAARGKFQKKRTGASTTEGTPAESGTPVAGAEA